MEHRETHRLAQVLKLNHGCFSHFGISVGQFEELLVLLTPYIKEKGSEQRF